jgi:pimeloyl-ACP methyl ester carboxylesterase
MSPEERVRTAEESASRSLFAELQNQLLRHYGVTAISRYVDLKEPPMRAHLLEAGRGEPVVILHAGDGEAVNWAALMAPLQQDVHIYAVDRPGFGLSDPFDYRRVNLRTHAADFVRSLLDALGIETASLIACSMGGFFALAAAVAHRRRVRELILIGMPVGVSRSAPLPLRIICGVPGLSRLFVKSGASLESQRKHYRKMFHIDPATVPEIYFKTRVAGLMLPGVQDTWAVLLRRIAGLRGFRPQVYLGDALPKLEQPTLFIWGEKDMAPATIGQEASSRIPRGKFICLRGAGHFPFLQAPNDCARLIADFLHQG